RWDSLGEFLALGASLEHIALKFNNKKADILAQTLATATAKLLDQGHSPSRKTGELDNRGSHFYLALYWAQSLAEQTQDIELQTQFSILANRLSHKSSTIIDELHDIQGNSIELKGYYHPQEELIKHSMRPSKRFNSILN
ncbi:MAG: NADP-dependent isocitrate dehydrogenase, partial [Gammaproteobacteria bacterium]|nr:NADP-dependent isocitrate dehydrogenase [Gammaproteobacteria bacterium]